LDGRPAGSADQEMKSFKQAGLRWAQMPMGQAGLQTKLCPKYAYKTSNYPKGNVCN